VKFPRTGSFRTRTPLLGEHTDEVLSKWLGLAPDRIAALKEKGVT
jgi:crotonobetainyl-CoA:carnitine CoA-transferase CaiB-like acyl-CoA transferase